MKRRTTWAGVVLLVMSSIVAVFTPAYAAAGCRVTYTVPNQWAGGFGASVTVTNLGEPLTGWTLAFAFPHAGQTVSQGWNATWTQSGPNVAAANAGWNAALGTGASASLGFNGAWTTANPVPAAFALNGTACTGTTQPTTPPTTPPTTQPTAAPTTPPGPARTFTNPLKAQGPTRG